MVGRGVERRPARCSASDEPPGRPVKLQSFVQFLIIGLGAGATYALFAQGAVLIYRGSGLVNFAQGAIGTFAAYIAFVDLKDKQGWATLPALLVAVVAAGAVSLAVPGARPPRAAAGGVDRPGHRDDRPARSPPGCGREAIRRREPTGRLVPAPRRVEVGRHHGAGGAGLPRRHHPGRDVRAVGVDPVHPRRAGHQRQCRRTNGRCRRSAGRPTASPRSPGRSAGCSAGSPPSSPLRSPGCRPSRSRSW